MSVAYSMKNPPQPNTGGKNDGNSVYAYNPWLEAGFGPGDLPASQPGKDNGKQVANNVGVQTNCMSCHAQAAYSPTISDLESVLYTGDQYIDVKGPQFKGKLRTDFLWSIPDNAR
jgi:mono/diheme cytochrome c family protein